MFQAAVCLKYLCSQTMARKLLLKMCALLALLFKFVNTVQENIFIFGSICLEVCSYMWKCMLDFE